MERATPTPGPAERLSAGRGVRDVRHITRMSVSLSEHYILVPLRYKTYNTVRVYCATNNDHDKNVTRLLFSAIRSSPHILTDIGKYNPNKYSARLQARARSVSGRVARCGALRAPMRQLF
ncbi:hypothetical protein EVAR_66122_1 [Eumeta japonica]|uniref:Uncharacterized protein n=1 Tax=Eumeta variegata TaxID=151549 RepID=A0A4C1ZSP1_EUMVA|nr:hypothetical protein EVAR_66122_1 [Eumeta japonica]